MGITKQSNNPQLVCHNNFAMNFCLYICNIRNDILFKAIIHANNGVKYEYNSKISYNAINKNLTKSVLSENRSKK